MILWMPFFFLLDDSLESSALPWAAAAGVAGAAAPSLVAAAAGVAVPGAPAVTVVDVELGVDDDDSPAAAFAAGGFTGVLGAGGLVVGEAAAPGAGLLKGGFDGGVFAGGAAFSVGTGDGATAGVPGCTAPGASMICAPAAIVDPELPSVTAPPPSVTVVSAEPCSPTPPADDAATPNVGPAAPGFRMSVAETASVGGLRFGGPACAAVATSGFDLSISSGILRSAVW